ncbi:MAG: hypothetical protein FGM54_01860 [Chitinophagaceae bacterium]|nr:hypothetical protein [Chitinophagaceae bacterium]
MFLLIGKVSDDEKIAPVVVESAPIGLPLGPWNGKREEDEVSYADALQVSKQRTANSEQAIR